MGETSLNTESTSLTADSKVLFNGITQDNTNYTYTYPSPSYIYTQPYPTVNKYDLQVERVENGWVVEKQGKKYIIAKAEEILQYLK